MRSCGRSWRQAAGVLVCLDGGHVVTDRDDLAGYVISADIDHVEHRHPGKTGDFNQRTVHPHYLARARRGAGRTLGYPVHSVLTSAPSASSAWSARPGSEQST